MLSRALMDEPAFNEHGRNAATLILGRELRVIVTVIRAGVVLEEDQAGRPAHLTMLDSEIEWHDATRSEALVMRSGGGISFGGSLRHRVTARHDSALVLVFGAPLAESTSS